MKKIRILFLGILAAWMLSPVLFLVTGSLTGDVELQEMLAPVLQETPGYMEWKLFPLYPTLKSYVKLLFDSPEFYEMFWNSVKMTGEILAGQLLVAVPAAWGMAKFHFPGRKVLFTLYLVLMMMPFQVLMLSDYLVLAWLSLLDSQAGIVLPAVFSTFPVFIMYRFFCGVPDSLLEAARLDGAGEFQIFLKIGIPLGSPGILSALVLDFLEYWNLIEQPMAFLKTKALWPLSLFLPNIGMDRAGLAFATSVVVLIPAVCIFLAGQEYLEQGIVATASKE